MGYNVQRLQLHSMDDNKVYEVERPEKTPIMMQSFVTVLDDMRKFDMKLFLQTNVAKCRHCIYQPICDRSLEELEC